MTGPSGELGCGELDFRVFKTPRQSRTEMTIDSDFTSDRSVSHNVPKNVLAIVGVGLLGGSAALAVKQRGLAEKVIGIGRNPERLQAAVDAGVIDEFLTELPTGDAEWTTVVVGTPVDRIAADVLRIAAVSRPGTLITDVGSVKTSICDVVGNSNLPNGVTFVGSHPLAGSEKTGFEAARADLFVGRVTVVTSRSATDDAACLAVRRFWEQLGSRVVEMSPEDHDIALATTSHLPHVAAAALAATLPEAFQPLAASGFRDSTRIAAGDPDLWVAILLENAAAVGVSIAAFSESFRKFQEAIENRDAVELKKLLQLAKRNRDAV